MRIDCPEAAADLSFSCMNEANRRLAGILAADVVGYSAKMGADDVNTLARVRTMRTDVIEPLATTHGGRVFKTMGDGFLVEFPSAVQALRCAIAIQTALNAEVEGLRLRIGVHQGEVVAEGDDPFGDGIIVAARLEPLAEDGGIVISSRVKEDASGKIALEVDDPRRASAEKRRGARQSVPRPHHWRRYDRRSCSGLGQTLHSRVAFYQHERRARAGVLR